MQDLKFQKQRFEALCILMFLKFISMTDSNLLLLKEDNISENNYCVDIQEDDDHNCNDEAHDLPVSSLRNLLKSIDDRNLLIENQIRFLNDLVASNQVELLRLNSVLHVTQERTSYLNINRKTTGSYAVNSEGFNQGTSDSMAQAEDVSKLIKIYKQSDSYFSNNAKKRKNRRRKIDLFNDQRQKNSAKKQVGKKQIDISNNDESDTNETYFATINDSLLRSKIEKFQGFPTETQKAFNCAEDDFLIILAKLKLNIMNFPELFGLVYEFYEQKQTIIDLMSKPNNIIYKLLQEIISISDYFQELKNQYKLLNNTGMLGIITRPMKIFHWMISVLIFRLCLELENCKVLNYNGIFLYSLHFFDKVVMGTLLYKCTIIQYWNLVCNQQLNYEVHAYNPIGNCVDSYDNLHYLNIDSQNSEAYITLCVCFINNLHSGYKSLFYNEKFTHNQTFKNFHNFLYSKDIIEKVNLLQKIKNIDINIQNMFKRYLI